MSISTELHAAARDAGRSIGTLLIDWLSLRFARGRIGLSEYLEYGLHRPGLTRVQKLAFGGWRVQRALEEILVDSYSRILTLDKVTSLGVLRGAGVPTARVFAVYARSRRVGPFEALCGEGELASFLARPPQLPLYAKPAFGVHGKGNFCIVDANERGVVTRTGERLSIPALAARMAGRATFGWMLQEELLPHPEIVAQFGGRVSGLRLIVFLGRSGPRVIRAAWKINVNSTVDNFLRGSTGNLLAAVDVRSGTVTRVVSGVGPVQREIDPHPATGRRLVGFELPCWSEATALVERASLAFPGFLCQGWDIALCGDGPVALEVNDFSDLDILQYAHGSGFLDDEFMRLLAESGLARLLTGWRGSLRRNRRNGRLGRRASHWNW